MDQPYDKDIATLIEDKVVVYGARLTGMGDLYETPTHGLQPGARIHAVALDNLFLYGPKGFKRTTLSETGELGFTLVSIAVSFLILALMVWAFRIIEERKLAAGPKWFLEFAVLLASFLLLFLACLVFYRALNRAPVNWIGLIALFTFVWSIYGRHAPDLAIRFYHWSIDKLRALFRSRDKHAPSNGVEK